MIHRANQSAVVLFEDGEIYLDPTRNYDDDDPFVARLVKRWAIYFDTPNVEAATAAPGERRSTRRTAAK